MKGFATVVTAVALAVLLTTAVSWQAYAQQTDPSSVVRAWVAELGVHDFDAAVSLLADDARITFVPPPPGKADTQVGRDEVKQELLNTHTDRAQIKLVGTPIVDGDNVSWVERQSSEDLASLGIDSVDFQAEGVVTGGQIKSILYTLTPASAAKVEAAISISEAAPTGMPRTGGVPSLYGQLALLGSLLFAVGLLVNALACHRVRAWQGGSKPSRSGYSG